MMSCREVTERASRLVDGELTAGERFRVRVHLAMCHHCRRFVRQLRATVRTLGGLRDAEPAVTPDEEAQLLELFRQRPK